MRYRDLTEQDQETLATDFGGLEKEAAEHIALAEEGYEVGFHKLAKEIADAMEVEAAETMAKIASGEADDDDDEEEEDEEHTKKAEDIGAFIEKGTFDGLMKLGEERYGDSMVYIEPLIMEKLGKGKKKKPGKANAKQMQELLGKWEDKKNMSQRMEGKGALGKAVEWAKNPVFGKHTATNTSAHEDFRIAKKLRKGGTITGKGGKKIKVKGSLLNASKYYARGAAKYSPHVAVAGAGLAGAKHMLTRGNSDGHSKAASDFEAMADRIADSFTEE
jgi:hypothetical protein